MQDYSSTTMTCVERYTGNRLKLSGTAFQYAIYRNGVDEQLTIVANWVAGTTAPGEIPKLLSCVWNGTTYSFTTRSGWEDPVCVVPYTGENISYALTPAGGATMLYNGSRVTEYQLTPNVYTTPPAMTVTVPTLYGSHSQTIRWTLTAGDERKGWVVTMSMRSREVGSTTESETELFTNSLHVYYILQTDSTIVGKEVCLVLEYRTYAQDWNGSDQDAFVTCNRYVTPWQYVSRDAAIPLSPEGLTTSLLLAGGKVTVSWQAVVDPLNTISSYRLERSVNGGSYTSLYSGTSTQFRDTLPTSAQNVVYRVCAVNNKSVASPWTDSGTLAVAQSNLYVAKGGKWVRAAGVWIGEKRASPMAQAK